MQCSSKIYQKESYSHHKIPQIFIYSHPITFNMEKEKKRVAAVLTFIALLYFLWIIIVVLKENGYIFATTNFLLSLREWAIIGILLYLIFVIIEVYYYLSFPKEEKKVEGIKLVSTVTKKVMCNNCKTVFTIADTGKRPLRYTCPNCGGEGALRGTVAEGIRKMVACEKCKNIFEIYDTGERPFAYKCPECHYENSLS